MNRYICLGRWVPPTCVSASDEVEAARPVFEQNRDLAEVVVDGPLPPANCGNAKLLPTRVVRRWQAARMPGAVPPARSFAAPAA